MGTKSMMELLFSEQIRSSYVESVAPVSGAARLPEPEREYRFHPTRDWRFDFAWPDHSNRHLAFFEPIAVEIEGGTWVAGRHSRGKGFEDDCEKYAEALIAGWRVLRVTSAMVEDGRAIALLRRLFDA